MRSAVLAAALVLAAACGTRGEGGARADGDGAGEGDGLTVLAAASLTEAFTEVGERFTAGGGAGVTFSFGASSSLVDQVREGAPADVVATASDATMQVLVDAGEVGRATVFARNALAIAVPAGNPAGVRGLADLGGPGLTLALCSPQVPCGELAREALAGQGVTARPDTEEEDVKGVLEKVAAGEVDAGIVYRTDVLGAGEAVGAVAVPDDQNVLATYPIAVVDGAGPGAEAFVDFVLSGDGQAVLRDAGFLAP